MKQLVVSITMLAVLISLIAMLLGSSVANARTAPKVKYELQENLNNEDGVSLETISNNK